MASAIRGFGALPAEQRAEALRFAVTAAAAAGGERRLTAEPLARNVGALVKEAKIDRMHLAERQQLAQDMAF